MRIFFAGESGPEKRERRWQRLFRKRLLSYWYIKQDGIDTHFAFNWLKQKHNYVMKEKKIELLMDSGAFSAWNKGIRIDFDEYINFCLENESYCDFIVNLDVIPGSPFKKSTKEDVENSVKEGWNNYKKMLEAGIPKEKLIHVFHQGEDFKWLQKMVKQIPYIGVSPANDKTTQQKIVWLDQCMPYVTDDKGMPIVKFHGFGVTSLPIMLRYPWYSVDSTSWVVTGRMGSIYIPRYRSGEWIYDEQSWKIAVSNRSPSQKEAGQHISTLTPKQREILLHYIHDKGYQLGHSDFRKVEQSHVLAENERWAEKKPTDKTAYREIEIITEPGISNKYQLRDEMNIIYFLDLEKSMPAWPWAFQRKEAQSGFFQ